MALDWTFPRTIVVAALVMWMVAAPLQSVMDSELASGVST